MIPLPPRSTLFPYTTLFRSSVEISKRSSSRLTESPSFLNHLVIVPSKMDSPIWGMTMFVDRKSTRLNSSHTVISYAVFCLKKKKKIKQYHNESKFSSTSERH